MQGKLDDVLLHLSFQNPLAIFFFPSVLKSKFFFWICVSSFSTSHILIMVVKCFAIEHKFTEEFLCFGNFQSPCTATVCDTSTILLLGNSVCNCARHCETNHLKIHVFISLKIIFEFGIPHLHSMQFFK